MFRGIVQTLTNRRAGPVASLAALALAIALAVTTTQAQKEQDFLRARIAALAAQDASQVQTELASCRAAVRTYAAAAADAGARQEPQQAAAGSRKPSELAAELVRTPPAGFDVCARMESADQAVLRSLEPR